MNENELAQGLRDAIALTTLWVDESESGNGLEAPLRLARELVAEHGEYIVTAQTHLLVRALTTLRDVLNEFPDDVALDGLDRPASVLALLRLLGASAA